MCVLSTCLTRNTRACQCKMHSWDVETKRHDIVQDCCSAAAPFMLVTPAHAKWPVTTMTTTIIIAAFTPTPCTQHQHDVITSHSQWIIAHFCFHSTNLVQSHCLRALGKYHPAERRLCLGVVYHDVAVSGQLYLRHPVILILDFIYPCLVIKLFIIQ